jgi:hypothetical protein
MICAHEITSIHYGGTLTKHILHIFFLITIIQSRQFEIIPQTKKLEFGAYGEIAYRHFDYGPNQKASVNGSLPDSRAEVDIPRFALKLESYFTEDIYLEAEVEFEHLGTGSSLELEYEEFGEYEFESEKGGEVLLEELHITKEFSEGISARFGRLIVPVGLLNVAHLPTDYFTSVESESETRLTPSVWSENGLEIFGQLSNSIKYKALIVNGLESTGFSSEKWITEGHQVKFETIKATNLAFVLRLDMDVIQDFTFGVSGYYGNTSRNRPKPEDMDDVDGNVSIGDFHAVYNNGDFITRGLVQYGHLENSDIISQKNSSISRNIQAPRTPVAEGALLYYIEAGYNILKFFDDTTSWKLFPFGRYEYYNSMEQVAGTVFADPRFKRNILTFGLNLFVLPNLVLKADYSMRNVGGFNSNYNDENTFGLSIGFYDWFVEF